MTRTTANGGITSGFSEMILRFLSAAYCDQEAASAEAKAALHRRSASNYKPSNMAGMCKGIADYWDKVAFDAKALAKGHRDMAKAAGSGGEQ
jgi:hypothetical protein